ERSFRAAATTTPTYQSGRWLEFVGRPVCWIFDEYLSRYLRAGGRRQLECQRRRPARVLGRSDARGGRTRNPGGDRHLLRRAGWSGSSDDGRQRDRHSHRLSSRRRALGVRRGVLAGGLLDELLRELRGDLLVAQEL